jgi:transcriptional regulator with XRE-family HTH domain
MESLNKMDMGKRIKEIRKRARLRQWQLAEILGTTQSAVHKYEHGVIPEPRRLVKLARLGNTTIEWILTGQHWENGSEGQERLQPDTYRLAERLQSLGPEQRRTLDDALRIVTEALEVMRSIHGNHHKIPDHSEMAAHLATIPEKQKGILAAALRIHRAVLESVLDLQMERLEGSSMDGSPGSPPVDPGSGEKPL